MLGSNRGRRGSVGFELVVEAWVVNSAVKLMPSDSLIVVTDGTMFLSVATLLT